MPSFSSAIGYVKSIKCSVLCMVRSTDTITTQDGYVYDFQAKRWSPNSLALGNYRACGKLRAKLENRELAPEELEALIACMWEKIQIFEASGGQSLTDPGDDVTVYFIETGEGDRGYIIVPASIYAEPAKAAFIDRLKTKPKPNADTAAP